MSQAGSAPLPIPATPDEVSPGWMTLALRTGGLLPEPDRVESLSWEAIGEELGFQGRIVRFTLGFDNGGGGAPRTLVAKFPSADPASRRAAELSHLHEREARFYGELSAVVPQRTPRCYFQSVDPPRTHTQPRTIPESTPVWMLRLLVPIGRYLAGRSEQRSMLLLEDMAGARFPDQVAGCTAAEAEQVVRSIAATHADFWERDDLKRLHWVPEVVSFPAYLHAEYRRWRPAYIERFRDVLPAFILEAASWLEENGARLLGRIRRLPWTLLHGDYRLDNLCFVDGSVTVFDWQLLQRGPGGYDLIDVVSSISDETGRGPVLRAYHQELVARGVAGYGLEQCRDDFLLCCLARLHVAIALLPLMAQRDGRHRDLLHQELRRVRPVELPDPRSLDR